MNINFVFKYYLIKFTFIPLNLDIAFNGLKARKVLSTFRKLRSVPALLAVNATLIIDTFFYENKRKDFYFL